MATKREKVVRAAEKLVNRGKLEAAIKEYRKVLAENPNDANTLNRVGDLYARIERFDEAVKLFSQIADQYTRDGFFVKAIAIYKKIIKLSPQSLQVYERLAELYYRQGLLNEARTQYQVLADHFEKRDNATSAINIYQRMTEIDPDSPAHYLKLARLYQGQQLTDKALRAYRQLADLFLVNGSIDEATRVYFSALDAYHQELDFVREVVGSLHSEGHTEAAQKVLRKAASLSPAAAAIGLDVFSAPQPGAPQPGALQPAAPELGTSEPAAGGEISLDFDDSAFELPEVPGGESVEKVAAFPVSQEEDDSVFTLDLDSDEPLATQVTPPADMLEPPPADEELDVGDAVAYEEPSADDLSGAEAPEEIDWSAGEIEIELEGSGAFDFGGMEVESESSAFLDAIGDAVHGPLDEIGADAATPVRHEEDLLAEARVFAKYGLREKADDRLQELLGLQPEHLGALALMARIAAEGGDLDDARRHATEVARIARESGEPQTWIELRDELSAAGLAFEEEEVSAAPAGALADSDRFARLLEDLDDTASGLPALTEEELAELGVRQRQGHVPEVADADLVTLDLEPSTAEAAERDSMLEIEELMRSVARQSGFEEFVPEETSLEDLMPATAEETQEPSAEAPRSGLVSLVDELDLGDLGDGAELAQEAAAAGQEAGAELDETGMSWLDEVPPPAAEAPDKSDAIFAEEDDFFDLAAELEAEMAEGEDQEKPLEPPQEQTLQDIIDGFKRGVAENLSAADFDTHYNLGIAYREMGLLDEAIGEFQLASKDPRYIVDCSSMLGLCFLDKGLPELAVRWYKKGLESPALDEDQALGLLYDLGNVYVSQGDIESAYRTFLEIYGMNSNYRDVAQRIKELQEEVAPP